MRFYISNVRNKKRKHGHYERCLYRYAWIDIYALLYMNYAKVYMWSLLSLCIVSEIEEMCKNIKLDLFESGLSRHNRSM